MAACTGTKDLISLCSFFGVILCWVYQNHVFYGIFAPVNKTHCYLPCLFWCQMQKVSTPVFAWISRPSFKNVGSILSNMHPKHVVIAVFSSIQSFLVFKAEKRKKRRSFSRIVALLRQSQTKNHVFSWATFTTPVTSKTWQDAKITHIFVVLALSPH